MPRESMCQKKSVNAPVSDRAAEEKSVTGPSVKKMLTIEPTWLMANGRSPSEAASRIPCRQRSPSSSSLS